MTTSSTPLTYMEACTTNCPRTFPCILPAGFRNRVYKHVIRSKTGTLSLRLSRPRIKPLRYRIYSGEIWSGQEIRLSFLRTCRMLYTECKDLLWSLNTWDVDYPLSSYMELQSHKQLQLGLNDFLTRVHSVALTLVFTYPASVVNFDSKPLTNILNNLRTLSEMGRLHSITINISSACRKAPAPFFAHPLLFTHLHMERFMGSTAPRKISDVLGKCHLPPTVLRRMCIHLGSPG